MDRDLKNKIVVITGGVQGIGYAIAVKFLTQSARVVVLDINDTKGSEAVKTLGAEFGVDRVAFIKCDVTKDLEEVSRKILYTYKRVDVLVNNAGTINEFDIRATFELNTTALIEWSMKFHEHMRTDKDGKGGTIINVSSIYGYISDPFLPFYKASKHAVLGFTKTLGHEDNFKKTGVRVVALCPGYTYSELTATIKIPGDKKWFEEYTKTYQWQQPEAVGDAAVEVFKVADSGTAWSIVGGQPIEKVPYIDH